MNIIRVSDVLLYDADPVERMEDGVCYISINDTLKKVFKDNGTPGKMDAPTHKIFFDFAPSDSNSILSTNLV